VAQSDWLYALPSAPVVSRFLVGLYWDWLMPVALPEEAQERDMQRGVILGLAGFAFTAAAALAILDAATRPSLQLSIWYVLVSFVSYLSALSIQSYKYRIWQDQLATALIEAGSLSLMLTLVTLLFAAKLEERFVWMSASVAIGAWLVDHAVKLRLFWRFLKALDEHERRGGAKWQQPRRLRRKR
jgi:hypothetical protein